MNDKVDKLLDKCGHCGRGGFPIDRAWIPVDLDGTILEEGHYPDYGPPIEGAIEGLQMLRKMGFKIMIWTNRMALTDINGRFKNQNQSFHELADVLDNYQVPYDYIMPLFHKPALVYKLIDDRAVPLDRKKGGWSSAIRHIMEDLAHRNVPIFGDKSPHLKKLVL